MKTASTALINLLNSSDQFCMADVYTITLRTGEVLRYASSDIDIMDGATTFSSNGPLFARDLTRCMLGLEVDTLSITINAGAAHQLNGMPFIAAAVQGALDGAKVTLGRAFMQSWAPTSGWAVAAVGVVTLFSGRVSDVDCSRNELKVKVKSELELLNIKMPRVVFETSCSKTLYSSACGASRAANTRTGLEVTAVVSKTKIYTSLDPYVVTGGMAMSDMDLGVIEFLTGPNAGISRTIKRYMYGDAGGTSPIEFAFPLPYLPQVGDTFNAVKGCTKSRTACQYFFNNLARYRGYPFVPSAETIT